MKIGELATKTGCPVETIRFYERSGLIPPPARSPGNFRTYGNSHFHRLVFIRHCRLLGMSLSEIVRLLHFHDTPDARCGEVNALLDRHLDDLRHRIQTLQELERQLAALRAECETTQAASECGILHHLGSLATMPGNIVQLKQQRK